SCVESQCIQRLSRGARAHFVAVPSFTGMLTVNDLVREGWTNAHPVDNSITLPTLMCLAAMRNGDRVMLHGVSGDITLDVPNRYVSFLMRNGLWGRAWSECMDASVNHNYLRGTSPATLFMLNAWTALAPFAFKRLARHAKLRANGTPAPLLNPRFSKQIDLPGRLRQQVITAASSPDPANIREVQAALLGGVNGIGLGLAGYGRLGKRFGLELRDPWADKRVVEYFLRLPLRAKISAGWTKYLVRASYGATMDDPVRWRLGKEHLGWKLTGRLMDESRLFVEHTLRHELDRLADFVNVDIVRRRIERYLQGSLDTDEHQQDRQLVHDLMVLIMWSKRLDTGSR
ncbi:MAG: asparagine synthase-related protein, partial [Ramlibacter sp.]|nr:asparagine synthase-related protein [Ramlibacter sp.]